MSRVRISMKSGDTHIARGYVDDIARQINQERPTGNLIQVERDRIPTGQMMHLDPNEVESIKSAD